MMATRSAKIHRKTVSQRIWSILETSEKGDKASHAFDVFIIVLIFLNVIAVILDSVQNIQFRISRFLTFFEIISVCIFSVEYFLRIAVCTSDSRYSHPIWGRIRFVLTPLALIDLLAIVPFFVTILRLDLRFIRVFRLFRFLRVLKSARYTKAFRLLKDVFREQIEELVLSFFMMINMLVLSSCLLYYVENPVQQDAFPSIPATMWWAVATLTTVGYGDIVPVTAFGKILASVVSILGVAFFALPAGIISSGFVEQLRRKHAAKNCPHCGKNIQ